MSELLNKISSNNLILLCVVMSVIALFLAVAIAIELFNNYKRKKRIELLTGKTDEEVLLNIKEDENVTYVEDDEELEKTKAKIELAKLKERLKKEEAEKKKLLELNLALASKENTVKEEKHEEVIENLDNDSKVVVVEKKEEKVEVLPVVENTPVEEKKEPVLVRVLPVEEKKVEEKKEEKVIEEIEILQDDDDVVVSVPETVEVIDIKKEEVVQEVPQNVKKAYEVLGYKFDEETISKYEDEDEEKAIISYDELKQKASTFGYSDEEMELYVDEKDAIISIQELERMHQEANTIKEEVTPSVDFSQFEMKRVVDLPEIADDKKFQNTPFISPIHGASVTDESILLEQTANLEKLNEEIKKTNEFLKTLKELKKNLQ